MVDTAVARALVQRARRAGAFLVTAALLASCGGSGSSPKTTPTPTPSPTSTAEAAFDCPSTAPASVARSGARLGSDATRFMPLNHRGTAGAGDFTRLAITYDRGSARVPVEGQLTARETAAGARYVTQLDLPHVNQVVRVISVPSAAAASAKAALRAQAGVRSVAVTGQRRYANTITTPYFPSDPYFQGFTAAQNETAGNPAPSTFQVLPYVESALVPGQWDMHAISLASAFAYSQPNNGSGIVNAFALGSSAVHIAVIDTGEDPTHPELATKIARQRCYITSPDNVQSKGNFSTDKLGHGTDVAGIAAADTGNAFGFSGAGGNAMIDAYRVFPTPDDNCTNPDSTDPQCGTDTADVASAITDAVSSGANIISMSLGGPSCTTAGVDPDPVEGAAVANAIASNVIVIAASGNGAPGTAGISAPACDDGVIAVGATSLDDGQPNGTASYGGTAAVPVEYVAGYSQFGAPAAAPKSPSAWGIVAPGGDPASNDLDNLHWIENIWTSTPYMSSPTDDSFTGQCNNDYPNDGGSTPPVDCRTLIAGTSMATPHVAGVAALILSVTGSKYATPAAMKTLLCETADDIGVNKNEGCGRINAYRAMATALGDPVLP